MMRRKRNIFLICTVLLLSNLPTRTLHHSYLYHTSLVVRAWVWNCACLLFREGWQIEVERNAIMWRWQLIQIRLFHIGYKFNLYLCLKIYYCKFICSFNQLHFFASPTFRNWEKNGRRPSCHNHFFSVSFTTFLTHITSSFGFSLPLCSWIVLSTFMTQEHCMLIFLYLQVTSECRTYLFPTSALVSIWL